MRVREFDDVAEAIDGFLSDPSRAMAELVMERDLRSREKAWRSRWLSEEQKSQIEIQGESELAEKPTEQSLGNVAEPIVAKPAKEVTQEKQKSRTVTQGKSELTGKSAEEVLSKIHVLFDDAHTHHLARMLVQTQHKKLKDAEIFELLDDDRSAAPGGYENWIAYLRKHPRPHEIVSKTRRKLIADGLIRSIQ